MGQSCSHQMTAFHYVRRRLYEGARQERIYMRCRQALQNGLVRLLGITLALYLSSLRVKVKSLRRLSNRPYHRSTSRVMT